MAKYTFHYFGVRVRGEISRLIFAAAGVKYKDNRISFRDWGPDSPIQAATPLGLLPYLEVDGVKIPQSISIARYLAREFNLHGKNNIEKAKADVVVDTVVELTNLYVTRRLYKIDRKTELWCQFKDIEIKQNFANINKLIKLYGSNGYSASDSLLWSDLVIYDACSQLLCDDFGFLNNFPRMKRVFETVEANPRIAEYVKNRKKTPF